MRRSVRPVLRRNASMSLSLGVDGDRPGVSGLAILDRGGAILLRTHEPAHQPQIAVGEPQRRIDPTFGHRVELLPADRVAKLSQSEYRLHAVLPPAVVGDPLLHRAFALAIFRQ